MRSHDERFVRLSLNVSETSFRGEVQGVLLVSGGVVFRRIQGVETEPFTLYLGGFGHGETDCPEDGYHFSCYQGERMQTSRVIAGRR